MKPYDLASKLRRLPKWSAKGRKEDVSSIVMLGPVNEQLSPLQQYVKVDDIWELIAELESKY